MTTDATIFDAIRTPRGRGKKDGRLYPVKPIDLLAGLLRELQQRNQLDTSQVDDLVLGCVTPIGEQGMVLPKAAAVYAGWDDDVPAMQINRFCASGLETVNMAAMKVRSGWEDLVVAGGVESMSRVPMGSDGGAMLDPEIGPKINFVPQGISADLIATLEGFSRRDVDEFALQSQQRAAAATENGRFTSLIPVYDKDGKLMLDQDEHIRPTTTLETLAGLKPAFAALVGTEPTIMLVGPAPASRKALKQAGMSINDIDLIEVNEAFAAVPLKFMRDMGLDSSEKINVNGGAIAMGHPLGATGAMLLGTALDELERTDQTTALITLCVGGGMGIATIIERV
jgi:acetyl-CoA C-acetyltransferase